jgi:hypothetical protein
MFLSSLFAWLAALLLTLAPAPAPVPPAAAVVVEHSTASRGDTAGTVRAPDARRGTDAPRPSLCPDGTNAVPVDAAGTLGCPGPELTEDHPTGITPPAPESPRPPFTGAEDCPECAGGEPPANGW